MRKNRYAPDDVYEHARQHFSDGELAKLTLAVVAINGWNRFGIAFRTPAGHYQPKRRHEAVMA
jgi:alkylhydroperoxidase family enzyme